MTRVRVRAALALLLGVVTAACGTPPAPPQTPKGARSPIERVRAVEQIEDEVLQDLASTDVRVAKRARITPGPHGKAGFGALVGEGADEVRADPFAFDERARSLANAQGKVASAPSDLPEQAASLLARPALERELLARLVDEEVVRLADERRLPRSASELVRAIVETWAPADGPASAAERDRWLARRLGEVRTTLAAPSSASLDVARARELDDALDALEHLVDVPGFTKATQELVRLREALEAQGARAQPARPPSDWDDIARGLWAHLGVAAGPDELDAELAVAEQAARDWASRAIVQANLSPDALAAKVAPLLFAGRDCVDAIPGSRLRSMAPPPERAAACGLRRLVLEAAEPGAQAAVATALHEHVVMARWALDVARGVPLDSAMAKHMRLARGAPGVQAHLERGVVARPTTTIGAGLAAAILLEGGDARARAEAWNAIGDAPFDITRRELARGRSSR